MAEAATLSMVRLVGDQTFYGVRLLTDNPSHVTK